MNISLTAQERTLTTDDIITLEQRLKHTLPKSYIEFLLLYNVGKPEQNKIDMDDASTTISIFLGICSTKMKDIVGILDLYNGRLHSDMIPIALAGGGNLICLDMASGYIYFWDHEEEPDEVGPSLPQNMKRIATSFEDFLNKITPFIIDDAVFNSVTVQSVKLKPGFADKFQKFT